MMGDIIPRSRVKVRHGLVMWTEHDDDLGRDVQRTAFRSMTVEMPDKEIARLKPFGAVVDDGAELEKTGRLSPLPDTASDQELLNWTASATKGEIAAAIAAQPRLADRILAAYDSVQEALEEQNRLLGGVTSAVDEGRRLAEQRESAEGATAGGVLTTPANPESLAGQEDVPDVLDDEALDELVNGNVKNVVQWLGQHPDNAERVLDAENRRVTREGEEGPRVGVEQAVKAAIAHRTG